MPLQANTRASTRPRPSSGSVPPSDGADKFICGMKASNGGKGVCQSIVSIFMIFLKKKVGIA